jgi:hypothetical protein
MAKLINIAPYEPKIVEHTLKGRVVHDSLADYEQNKQYRLTGESPGVRCYHCGSYYRSEKDAERHVCWSRFSSPSSAKDTPIPAFALVAKVTTEFGDPVKRGSYSFCGKGTREENWLSSWCTPTERGKNKRKKESWTTQINRQKGKSWKNLKHRKQWMVNI